MGLYSGGLIIGRIFASEIWGAYFREGLLSEFYGTFGVVYTILIMMKSFHLYSYPLLHHILLFLARANPQNKLSFIVSL